MNKKTIIPFLLFAITSVSAHAGYRVIGEIKGQVCKGFVIEACSMKVVAAVENNQGGLSEVKRYFNTVSEYKSSTSHCYVRIKSKSDSIFSKGADALLNPVFYERVDGQYRKIDVDYLSFQCRPV